MLRLRWSLRNCACSERYEAEEPSARASRPRKNPARRASRRRGALIARDENLSPAKRENLPALAVKVGGPVVHKAAPTLEEITARYVRMPRLLHELAVGRGDGSYARLLARLAKLDLLAIDDWMLAPLRDAERRDLNEVIEDRAERASTLIASQLPVTDWHAVIGDPNQADAICDRLLHDAHRIDLKGHSMRRTHEAPANRPKKTT